MSKTAIPAVTPGKRFALPHARIMMHQPSAGLGGTAADISIQADMLAQTKRQINELQAEHSGRSVEQVERDSERDRWFTAAEARTYGLIDSVIADTTALPQASTPFGIG